MATHRPKSLPKDPNQRAVAIGRILTGEDGCDEKDEGKDPKAIARGQKGGPARAAKLTATERSEAAKKAAQARWKGG